MISVPSLRQLSNGNSRQWVLAALMLMVTFSACDLFRKAQTGTPEEEQIGLIEGRRVYDPELGQWVVIKDLPTEPLDTIVWSTVPQSMSPPILSTGSAAGAEEEARLLRIGAMGSQFFNRYQVAMMLPLLADDLNPVENSYNPNSNWALHYYSGVKMALDELKNEGVQWDLTVLDSRGDEAQVNRLLTGQPDLQSAHLIIGPYRRVNIQQVAEFAKANNITYVSPYSAIGGLTSNNPNYIQVSPTLETHCRTLARLAKSRFSSDKIVLVCQDNPTESSFLRYFQDEHYLQEGSDQVPGLMEYKVPATSADFPAMQFDSLFSGRDSIALIVPSWSEPFVYNLLRKADLARSEELYLEIYGLPQWMYFEQIDYDYYEKLNVLVSSNFYLDSESEEVRTFKTRYLERFGLLPRTESYLGYDVTLYFGRMLQKYGTKFQYSLEKEEEEMLHTRFEFLPRFNPNPEMLSQQIDQFENDFVHILKFSDYLFQPIGANP